MPRFIDSCSGPPRTRAAGKHWISRLTLAQLAPASIVGRPLESLRHRRVGSSPVSWRSSNDLAKISVEGWLVSKPCFQCDLKQRFVGVQQQRLRGLNSPVKQVVTNGNSKGLLEGPHEAAWRELAFCRQIS